jgi:hypothetical protein
MADEYTSPPLTSCPPLTALQTYGICCPFLESEDEHDARTCIQNLQHYPIVWYRSLKMGEITNGITQGVVRGAEAVGVDRGTSTTVVQSAGSFIDGMLGTVDKLLGTSTKNVNKAHVPLTLVGVKAELSVVDTEEFGPVILVRQIQENDNDSKCSSHDNDADQLNNNNALDSTQQLPTTIIPLCKIHNICPGYSILNDPTAGGIKLYSRPNSFLSSGEELLRFDTLGGEGTSLLSGSLFPTSKVKPNEFSDSVMEQLRSLVEWNRRRVARDVKKGRLEVSEGKKVVPTESR